MWKTGNITPKTKVVLKLAEYFDVSPTYLMYGEDIAKEWAELMDTREEVKESSAETLNKILKSIKNIIYENDRADIFTGIPEEDLLYYFWNTSPEGQKKIIDYAEDIADNPKYRKDKE